MPANTGTVKIEIRVDDKGTVKVKQFGDQVDKTGRKGEQSFKRTGRSVGDFNRKLSKAHGTLLKFGAALASVFAARRIISAMQEWITLAGRQQEALAGMEQVMRSMGRYTPKFSKALQDNATALQKLTTFGDEATIEGTKFLLTYKQIGDEVLPRAQKTMLDLAALMGGDTVRAANMLGKASMGMTGELRRVGLTVEASTFKARGFLGVLEELEAQVAGQAEALAQTGIGPWKQLGNVWGDLKETLGDLILIAGSPVFKDLKIQIEDINEKFGQWVKNNEALIKQKVPEYIEKITTALKKIWEIISYDPDIIKYGIVGLALWGRKGAVLLGSLAHMKNWVDNLAKALGMASAGVLEFSEIATANFKELEELVKKGERLMRGSHFRGILVPPEEVKETTHEVKELARALEEAGNKSRDMWQDWAQTDEWVKKTKKAVTDFEVWKAEEKKKEVKKTEKAVNEMEEIYKNFLRNVQANFADTFYDIFSGQLDSFDDFLDSMKKSFLRMLAEMAAAAAMKKIVIPMATSMGSASGLFGGTQGTGTGTQLPSWVGTLGAYGMAAYAGWTVGQMIGKWMGLGKEKDARYRFAPEDYFRATYESGKGFEATTKLTHHGKGEEITDAIRDLYEQVVGQADALLKSVPMKLQEELAPYLSSIVFKPTDYNFKFKNAEQVIQEMAQKWTAQVEEAFNAAARAAGNASFAEMLAWEDIAWQASIMGGAISDLEVQIHNINEQFDAWIQQLTQLGSTEERLAQIEKYRQMALDGLTTSTANYARQIEGLQATLLSITTGSDSPLDAMERLALAKKAIGSAMGPDMTPEDINKIQGLWTNYLRVAQEVYQRPSLEYQNIYAETTAALNSLVGWLQGMESYQHGTDYVAVTGPAILHRGERVSRPGEGASVIVNFQPTIQVDGSRDSMRASREIEAEFIRLMRGKGRKVVQEAVKYQ